MEKQVNNLFWYKLELTPTFMSGTKYMRVEVDVFKKFFGDHNHVVESFYALVQEPNFFEKLFGVTYENKIIKIKKKLVNKAISHADIRYKNVMIQEKLIELESN